MKDPLSLSAAKLLATLFACILYGIYLVTLGITIRVLLTNASGKWRTRSELHWIVIVVCALLFTNATINLVLGMVQVMYAFTGYTGPGGAMQIFLHSSSWQTMVKTVGVGLQTQIGDALLIYRCWRVLHESSWIAPAVLAVIWLASFAIHVRAMHLLGQVNQGLVTSAILQPWLQSFWALTIVINIIATGLIVWRIWRVEKYNESLKEPNPNRPRTALNRAIHNIVESGMIYTVASVLMFASYAAKSTLNFPASAVEIHSVGISFNLIIIRAKHPAQDRTFTSINFVQKPAKDSANIANDLKTESFPMTVSTVSQY
ncbi:hypothetical protein C8J57DRAFT_1349597 [Mycena rebaudengoi]|nr:hypothetical protein C8J57DRAFT_1394073 [Mycena rebaudengoi]KAJ7252887.1 hypothetical protein C8J57DRAFT_1349597 [Mycena rebaudengoi]